MGIEGVRGLVADLSAGSDELATGLSRIPSVEGVALARRLGQLAVSVTEDNDHAVILKHAAAGVEGYIYVDGQFLGAAVALAVTIAVRVGGVLVIAEAAGGAALCPPVTGLVIVLPHTVAERMTGVVVCRVAAIAAVVGAAVLRVVVRAPRAVGETVALIARVADRVSADIAVFRHTVLAGGVLLILLAG